MTQWLLPEYIADVLPNEARQIEALRRQLLDLYQRYGYELVIPPLLEYLDSLLTGTGQDLNLRTFKLVDQLSGRTLGVRADITPQVARIDAHLLNRQGVVRLSYAGSVLHTRPASMNATREPLQIGAELYGHTGIEADIEIAELALASLALANVAQARIDLSHIGVVRAVLADSALSDEWTERIIGLLRTKDVPGLLELSDLPTATTQALVNLCQLYGGTEVLARARRELPAQPAISQALDEVERLAIALKQRGAQVTVDLAEMRGYQYHSGIVFALYCHDMPSALVRGGRYDQVGQVFGRARAATGFSLDLRELAALALPVPTRAAVSAPWQEPSSTPSQQDAALRELIAQLRAAGEIVVQTLPGHENQPQEYGCDRVIEKTADGWKVKPVEKLF